MAGNPMTVVSNDGRASRVTGFARHEMQEAMAGAQADDKVIEDEFGGVGGWGRGATDTLVTYLFLYRNNVKTYIYINATNDGLVITTTKP